MAASAAVAAEQRAQLELEQLEPLAQRRRAALELPRVERLAARAEVEPDLRARPQAGLDALAGARDRAREK